MSQPSSLEDVIYMVQTVCEVLQLFTPLMTYKPVLSNIPIYPLLDPLFLRTTLPPLRHLRFLEHQLPTTAQPSALSPPCSLSPGPFLRVARARDTPHAVCPIPPTTLDSAPCTDKAAHE